MEQSWELCKENIQPLKKGRMINELLASLGPSDGSTAESANRKKAEKKSEFEAELRAYKGIDPLDPWSRYINWVEQNYPKGCRDGNMIVLLEKCLAALHEKAKYHEDNRFLDVWMKYLDNTENGKESYEQLYSQGYFKSLAEFYARWADVLEISGNMKEAERIHKLGLRNEAKPVQLLQESLARFQARVATNTVNAMRSSLHDNDEAEQENQGRSVFNALKPMGKKAIAPIIRIGDHVKGRAGVVPVASHVPKPTGSQHGHSKPGITVYQDENEISTDQPFAPGTAPPIQTKVNKENSSQPGAWSKVRLGQKTTGIVPLAQPSTYVAPAFHIHEDPGQPAKVATPHKTVLSNILKPRKPEHTEEVIKTPLFFQEAQDPTLKFMCCLDRIYAGTTEYSIEQLRALEYKQNPRRLPKAQPPQEPPKVVDPCVEFLTEEEFNSIPGMVPEPPDSTKKYMACFKDIYVNNNEKSIEELRALRAKERARAVSPKAPIAKTFGEMSTQTDIAGIDIPLLPETPQNGLLRQESAPSVKETSLLNIPGIRKDPLPPISAQNSVLEGKQEIPPSKETSLLDKTTEPTVHTRMARNFIDNLFSGSAIMPEPSLKPTVEPAMESGSFKPKFAVYRDETVSNPVEPVIESGPFKPRFEVYRDETVSNPVQLPVLDTAVQKFNTPIDVIKSNVPTQRLFEVFCDDNENAEGKFACEPARNQAVKPKRKALGVVEVTPSALIEGEPICPAFQVFVDPQEEKAKPVAIYEDPDSHSPTKALLKPNSLNIYIDPEERRETRKENQPELFAELAKQLKALEEDEDKENERPADSVAPQKRTPLAGILQPALDIATGPPEEVQENEEDGKIAEEISVIPPFPADLTNFTLLPPRSVGLFAQGLKVSSTPMLPLFNVQQRRNDNEDSTSAALGLASRTLSKVDSKPESKEDLVENRVIEVLAHKLSPIMELSREFRSTSSSCASSSSASSAGSQSNCTQGLLTSWGKTKLDVLREDTQTSPSADFLAAHLTKVSHPESVVGQVLEGDHDPFDEKIRGHWLFQRKEVWSQKAGFEVVNSNLPAIKQNTAFQAGGFGYRIKECIGKGAYAKVFTAERDNDMQHVVLKVQVEVGLWEFYICSELRSRLTEHCYDFVADGCMQVDHGIFYNNGNILVNEYCPKGTLLDVINAYKLKNTGMPEVLVLYFSCELLYILEGLKAAEIIHGDIKADNIMLQNFPCLSKTLENWSEKSVFAYEVNTLKLIDWGRSIDMSLYPPKTSFMNVFSTADFCCIEMRTGKPWSYQLDYFATVRVIWNMLLSVYVKCIKMSDLWRAGSLKRWHSPVWRTVDSTLLNIESCDDLPDLKVLRQTLQRELLKYKQREFRDRVKELESMMNAR